MDFEIGGADSADDVLLLSQCTEIEGGLLVREASIQSMVGLEKLTIISGNLSFVQNGSWTYLEGLGNLVSIGGYLGIEDNTAIAGVDSRDSLTVVSGEVLIKNNPDLAYVDGLTALKTVGGYLRFSR